MKRCTVNGVELATVDRGRGLPVLLVHGFPLDHSMWQGQIEALSDRYRVIAPDLRGCGQSGVTEGPVTMEQFADDLAGLLDALAVQSPVVYCGLSMGGYIAWPFCRRHGRRLAGLILCDTRAAPDTPQAAAGRQDMAQRVLREGPSPLVESLLPRLFAETTCRDRPELVEAVHRVMMGTDRRGIAAATLGMAVRADGTPLLPHIDCPTLVIVGESDAIAPAAEMEGIAHAIPNARLVRIPGAGHMAPMEQPAAVSQAMLDFLGSLAK